MTGNATPNVPAQARLVRLFVHRPIIARPSEAASSLSDLGTLRRPQHTSKKTATSLYPCGTLSCTSLRSSTERKTLPAPVLHVANYSARHRHTKDFRRRDL